MPGLGFLLGVTYLGYFFQIRDLFTGGSRDIRDILAFSA
jgi:hypothetical protein